MARQNLDIHVGVKDDASGPLEALAQKARQLRREDAKSGENALGGFLNQGAGGLANFGLSAIGLGAIGMVADFASKSADSLMTSIDEVQAGRKTMSETFEQFAKGIPVVGSFGTALAHFIDGVMGHAGGLDEYNRKADERTQRQVDRVRADADVNTLASTLGKQLTRNLADSQGGPLAAARNQINNELQDTLEKISAARSALPVFDEKDGLGFLHTSKARQDSLDKLADMDVKAHELAGSKLAALNDKDDKEESDRFVKRAEAMREQAQTFASLDSEARQASLKANGDELEAELEQIREHADDRRRELEKQTLNDLESQRQRAAAMVDIAETEASQIAEARRKHQTSEFLADYAARGGLVAARAGLLALNGNTLAANRLQTRESFDAQIRALALSLGDPSTDAYQRRAALQAIASLRVTRDQSLQTLLGNGPEFGNRAASAVTDRYTTGIGDSLLTKTAAVDTARAAKKLVEKADETLKILQKIYDKGGGAPAILAAVGSN